MEWNSGFHPTNWISPFSLPGENVSSSNDASRSKSPMKKSLGQRYCHVYREGELEELPPGELFLMGKHPPSFFPTKNGPEEVCENRGPGTPPCFFFRIEAMMGRFLAFFRNFSDGFKDTLALCDFLPTPQKWWTLEVQFFARKENTCKNFWS